ncbi:hypothetical protein [Actinocrinis sp.]|uniref:hypothetical protein n=1 Tax=Actinocrinis sp. TaxID=1920516 RepID=UPI002C133204|nr:hypothetical protein [Actinocrinis sp.]HXR72781.1 hypothetical protein [Actinocrinis sp.]
MSERKQILLRLDPAVHDALVRWAADELRSTTAQIEFLLRQSLNNAGRMPKQVGGLPRRGRPRKQADTSENAATEGDGSDDSGSNEHEP